MAESVVKIRIDSQEYDAKLKKASEALNRYFNTVRQGGGTLKHLDTGVLEATRSIGKMETVSQSAKGKMRELTASYTDMAMQFRQLSAEEKNSEFGKALSQSLDQLKGRIAETKRGLADINDELGETKGGGKLDNMLAVFGGTMLTKVATGIATFASTAKDKIKEVIDEGVELARQGEGIRIAFDRLNRPDLLDKLREATHGTVTDLELMKQAVKFNDFNLSLDEMGTMLAFAQQKAKDTGQSVDYMVDSIVTGLGRQSLMILDNLGLSASEVKARMKETGDMTKAVGAIIREQMSAAGEHIETAADRAKKADVEMKNAMEELGRTFLPLKEAGESMFNSLAIAAIDALNKMRPFFDQFTEAGRLRNMLKQTDGGESGPSKVDTQIQKLKVAKKSGSTYYTNTYYQEQIENYNREINDANAFIKRFDKNRSSVNVVLSEAKKRFSREFDSINELKTYMGAIAAMRDEFTSRADKEVFNPVTEKKPIPTTTDENKKKKEKRELTEIQKNQEQIKTLQEEYVKLGDESTEAVRERQAEIQREIELLKERNGLLELRAEQALGRLDVGAGDFQRDGLNKTPGTLLSSPDTSGRDSLGNLKLLLDEKSMKAVTKNIEKSLEKQENNGLEAVGKLGQVAGSMSSILGGLSQLGIEIPEGLKDILSGVQVITGILGTIASLIEVGNILGLFSQGGVVHAASGLTVPGNYLSNDKVPALLNSGELVLNRAQQGVLATALTNDNRQGVDSQPYLTGEVMWMGLNNYLARRGLGEIVTTRG